MVKRSIWFGAALLVQIGILAALPLGRNDLGRNEPGKRIWLSAKVTNLRNAMRGSGIRLNYDIERIEERRKRGETVYATLRRQADSTWSVETAWADRPLDVSPASILIRGKTARRWEPIHVILHKKSDGTWLADSVAIGQVDTPFRNVESHRAVATASVPRDFVDMGIGYCDVPENLRKRIVQDIRKHPEQFAALVRVDPEGRASLLGFRVQDREFRFEAW